MTTASVEWVNLGPSEAVGHFKTSEGRHSQNVLRDVQGTPARLAVTGTATTAGSRPVAPAGARYARVTAVDGNVIVAWGADPTASQTNGIVIPAGMVEPVPIEEGQKLSFIELA